MGENMKYTCCRFFGKTTHFDEAFRRVLANMSEGNFAPAKDFLKNANPNKPGQIAEVKARLYAHKTIARAKQAEALRGTNNEQSYPGCK